VAEPGAGALARGWRTEDDGDPRLARDFETIAGLAARGDPETIRIHGARTHNLKNVDVTLPRNRLVVVTGPSGSGKSSLAFDTLYAEGQRRYVESLSSYARQFLDQLARPEVESIEGLSPAVAIEQKGVGRSPRSTVGTITEIADHLRLLFARAGTAHCWQCGAAISQQGLEEMVDRVLALPEGTRVQVLAPVVRGRKGQYKKELLQFRRDGFARARIDGEMRDLAEDIALARGARHDIEIVVDRIAVKAGVRARLSESLATALRLADDIALIDVVDGGDSAGGGGGRGEGKRDAGTRESQWWLSRSGACPTCEISFPELSPRLFSFNNPFGACKGCGGLGQHAVFDARLVVPDETRSLAGGAIAAWDLREARGYYRKLLEQVAVPLGIELETPWRELPAEARRKLIEGDPAIEVSLAKLVRPFDGVLGDLARRLEEREGRADASLARFQSERACPDCKGARLRIEARSVRVGGRSLPELSALPISSLARFFEALALPDLRAKIAERILKEVRERLAFLAQVGLGYLSLDRPAATLSGGEAQRIRLATQIGARLIGVLYILDEPSIGLHARDNDRLLASLEALRDQGNSLVVVEHDEATIRAADWVVDLGPGAGVHGGEVVAAGPPDALAQHPASLTGAYLSGRRRIPAAVRRDRRDDPAAVDPRTAAGADADAGASAALPPRGAASLRLEGCTAHNLKNVDVEIPLGAFTVVTGVSGSGKSSLVNDTLKPILAARLYGALATPGPFRAIVGAERIDKLVDVDQSPIGRSPRSNPATYSDAFTAIRGLFAQIPEARVRGWGPGHFSFNVKGGRCEACEGDGAIRVEMQFLPDVFVPCEVCGGRRYDRDTLAIRYRGRSIADVLEQTVEEALALFESVPVVARPLQALADVGLGYVRLGQSATTLSGGEAQRMKLAKELARKSTGRTLYLLDEPTTGLHFVDVELLLGLLHRLVERGNTVVVIEHHLDVIRSADHLIDLGPEAGAEGGEIVATGTPEAVARCERSHTGRALAKQFERERSEALASGARRDRIDA